jgi:hypothetical protein
MKFQAGSVLSPKFANFFCLSEREQTGNLARLTQSRLVARPARSD